MGFCFLFFFLLHLYSIDICNGWKINVSDVPVNVNKIKPILRGTRHVQSGVMTELGRCSAGECQGLRADFCRCFGLGVGGVV